MHKNKKEVTHCQSRLKNRNMNIESMKVKNQIHQVSKSQKKSVGVIY